MTKTEIVYSLFAITRLPVEGLDQETSDAVAGEVDRFNAGKTSRTKTDDLETMLDKVAAAIGQPETDRRVALRKSMDALTEKGQNDGGYTEAFGKDVVHAWLADRDVKVAKRASAKTLDAKVKTQKESVWEDEPDHVAAQKRTEAIDAEAQAQQRKDAEAERKAAASSSSGSGSAAPSKALTITAPVAVECGKPSKGTFKGTMQVDATIVGEDGTVYSSASKFARTVLGMQSANGWLLVTYLDGETRKPVDGLRINSKGYSLNGGRKPRAAKGVPAAELEVQRMEARVRRLTDSLTKATANLETARTDLVEAKRLHVKEGIEAEGNSEPAPAPTPEPEAAPEAKTEEPDCAPDVDPREAELQSMKVGALRKIATTLKISGRSKLKGAALVAAILSAEAA